jgi:hypothetical protein
MPILLFGTLHKPEKIVHCQSRSLIRYAQIGSENLDSREPSDLLLI